MAGYDDQLAFAEKIPGVNSRGPIAKIETDRQRITPTQLATWARVTHVPIEWFFVDFAAVVPEPVYEDPLAMLSDLDDRIAEARKK